MGNIYRFNKEKLVIPFLLVKSDLVTGLLKNLEAQWGKIDFFSEPKPFASTNYYQDDMGLQLWRGFAAFEDLLDPQELADIKIRTNQIEDDFMRDGKRQVNLDPGFLALSRFVLATTKENAHRIPLQKGIFAEITLLYRKNRFIALDWTYPDYRTEEYNQILCQIRTIYKAQLNRESGTDRYIRV
jgi:hypothetical protein